MKNSKPLQIGITGGIGAGKSLVCKVFAMLGIPVYPADERARWLMAYDPELKEAIRQNFGHEAILPNGELNRQFLARQVFNNKQKLEKINSLVHPQVGKDQQMWVEAHRQAPYVVKEAALMFESGSYRQLDEVVLIWAPEDLRVQRVQKRDPNRTTEDIKAIMAKQMPEKEKKKLAGTILVNDGRQMLLPAILELHRQYMVRAGQSAS